MKRNAIKAISTTAVLSLLLSPALPVTSAKAAAGEVTKLSGADCYETAAVVATQNWTSTDNVILASGGGYADAISSAVLAKQLNAPVLLTEAGSLNSNVKSALDKLKPKNIYIIGGTASICQKTRDELKSENYNLIELGGKNRYDTNIEVAKQLVKLGMSADNVMMVGGEGFPDALSAAPVAAAKGEILLLGVNSTQAMSPVTDFIKSNNSKVTVVGTQTLINDSTYKSIGAVNRISGGSDRFATNLNILNQFDGELKSDKIYIANASGDKYADALIAASVAGINDAPLVLVAGQDDNGTANAMNYIKNKAGKTTDLNLVEENGTVSDKTISDINAAASGSGVESATVGSVTTNGLNQVKVVFNTDVDKDSAERAANYEIDGDHLGYTAQTQATATLQEDNRTVLITFSHPFNLSKSVTFTVKSAVNTKNLGVTIPKYDKQITFSSVGTPTLDSITPIGGNKLRVKFSEPIRMDSSNLSSFKINRQSITAFGINTSDSSTKFRDKSLDGIWADGVDLYFNSPLPIGKNTFTVPNGEAGGKFSNAANIPISSTSEDFTVNSVSGNPQVQSVTSNNVDTIYVKYNRPMDEQTALEPSNYKINGTTVNVDDSYVTFDTGSGDTVVKITKIGDLLKSGENTITAKGNVIDTFGNYINESNMNLYVGGDTTKPAVTTASILDEETMRIKFNKDVSTSYAENKGNYTILDSTGTNITYKIDYINSITVDGNSKRTFDIKFKDNDLKGSKYTLTVKNIIDTESAPNIMDNYTTTLSGMDNEGTNVTEILRRVDNPHAVAIFFSKSMDQSSLENSANYMFKDGQGNTRSLPSSAMVTSSIDGKSVTIEFNSGYTIGSGSSGSSVIKMGVKNLKDVDGNPLDIGSYMGDITIDDNNDGPGLVAGTAQMTFINKNIYVKVSLSKPLDVLSLNDFRVAGYAPDTGSTSGNDVTLVFQSGIKNNQKINAIKNAGSMTNVSIENTSSVDAAGRNIKSGSTVVYIPPLTNQDMWSASPNSSMNVINVAFNQDIDDDIVTSYNDDFLFTDEETGQQLTPTSVWVNSRTVVYRFNNSTFNKGDRILVRANSDSSKINIRSENHNTSGYTIYSPSDDDISGKVITVGE
ncbi:cell wall-binding repeat-containing protein [Clostridium sp. 001]|uniref:cell wall-binding repeat-containing protein n=1 Tax=Clostridium sp. 001 TaxID=1970093 RepID=UPI001C2B7AFC|nr:cell wall-binding repeat-containing protein [Clostridium sp. 001]QXE19740.1 cell surface protein [Clostridium sp. 001]